MGIDGTVADRAGTVSPGGPTAKVGTAPEVIAAMIDRTELDGPLAAPRRR
jgi:hypothetical protein